MKTEDFNTFYDLAKATCVFYGMKHIRYGQKWISEYDSCQAVKKYYCRCDGKCSFYKNKEQWELYEYNYKEASNNPQLFIRRKLQHG